MKVNKFFHFAIAVIATTVAIVAYLPNIYFGGTVQISNRQAKAAESSEQIRAENNIVMCKIVFLL
jgi:hypothetical protein